MCLKIIPVHELIILHILQTFHPIPYHTWPKCLEFLLSRGYEKCPVYKQPHLYFRFDASLMSPTTIIPTPTPSFPPQQRLSPGRSFSPSDIYLLRKNLLYMLPHPFAINQLFSYLLNSVVH